MLTLSDRGQTGSFLPRDGFNFRYRKRKSDQNKNINRNAKTTHILLGILYHNFFDSLHVKPEYIYLSMGKAIEAAIRLIANPGTNAGKTKPR